MISEKDFYFPLIYLPSRYRTVFFGTVCYWKAFYQKVQRANHIQSRSLNQPISIYASNYASFVGLLMQIFPFLTWLSFFSRKLKFL